MAARKRGITEEDVVRAAVKIADARGLEGVTLAAVAKEVKVRSPSLYAHVDGLDGLRRLLALYAAGVMADALNEAVRGRHGLEALRAIAYEYRSFGHRHPGLYSAVQRAVRPGEDDELYNALAAAIVPVVTALSEDGVPPDDLIHMTRALRSGLHGFVELERSSGFGMPESVDESFDRLVTMLLAGVRETPRT